MKHLQLCIAALLVSCGNASADDSELFKSVALQLRLKQEGVYDGKIDGRFGVGSSAAMTLYASKNGIKNNESAIIEHMAAKATQSRIKPSAGMIEATINAIKDTLKDPLTADISVDYAQLLEGGASVCGTVNARNSYGAYSGRQAFQVTLIPLPESNPPFVGKGRLEEDGAGWLCLLGTSILPLIQRVDKN